MSDLDHLTAEEIENVLSIYPKKSESINDGPPIAEPVKTAEEKPEVDSSKVLHKPDDKSSVEWKDGYLEYEKKSPTSDRVVFEENEIEITEEDLE